MPLDEVIEHRWPDFVVPLQRAAAVEASMGIEPKSRHAQNATMENMEQSRHAGTHAKTQHATTISYVATRVSNDLAQFSPEIKKSHI